MTASAYYTMFDDVLDQVEQGHPQDIEYNDHSQLNLKMAVHHYNNSAFSNMRNRKGKALIYRKIKNESSEIVFRVLFLKQFSECESNSLRVSEGHRLGKLTHSDIEEIRASNSGSDELAKKYNVSRKTIKYARSLTYWQPLPQPPQGK